MSFQTEPLANNSNEIPQPTVNYDASTNLESEASNQILPDMDIFLGEVLEAPKSNLSQDDEGCYTSHRYSTTTIESEFLYNVEENGRTYHQLSEGQYLLPNDEREQDRLGEILDLQVMRKLMESDLQHRLWRLTLKESLHLAPIEQVILGGRGKVLDVGTGTGIWTMEFADQHPNTTVLGIDLSAIQPSFVPPNLEFQEDDLEKDWAFSGKFNNIHGRMLFSCFKDPAGVIAQAAYALNPGGYLELQDALLTFRSDEKTLDKTSLLEWVKMLHEGAKRLGKDWTCTAKYKEYMENAGLEDVKEVHIRWPIHVWAPDEHHQELRKWCHVDLLDGLEAISLAALSSGIGKRLEEIQAILVGVRKQINNPNNRAYIPISVVYGRKRQ